MKISKKSATYDTYNLEVSFTEMGALLSSLETDHANPVADEMRAAIKWYVERLPEPGSDDTKLRQPEDAELSPPEEGDNSTEKNLDLEKDLPEPPTEEDDFNVDAYSEGEHSEGNSE